MEKLPNGGSLFGVGVVVYWKINSGYGRANNALDRSKDGGSVFSPPSFRFAVGTDWRHLTNSVLDWAHDPGLVLRRVLRWAHGVQGGRSGPVPFLCTA